MSDKDLIPQTEQCCKKKWKNVNRGGASGAVYGLGFVGALFYFIQHATSFQDGIVGILKAVVWPALVVYKLLGFLKI